MHEFANIGHPYTLSCPGYNPQYGTGSTVFFEWYKKLEPTHSLDSNDNQVAFYSVANGMEEHTNVTKGDLAGRAWLSRQTGEVTIGSLLWDDNSQYVCETHVIGLANLHLHVISKYSTVIDQQ